MVCEKCGKRGNEVFLISDVIDEDYLEYFDNFPYEYACYKCIKKHLKRMKVFFDIEDVLVKYPRLIGHMICESLGYFTPKAAANALLHYKRNMPFYCEWYCHTTELKLKNKNLPYHDQEYKNELLLVGRDVVRWAYKARHSHKGYMKDYQLAKKIVEQSIKGKDPEFASWF